MLGLLGALSIGIDVECVHDLEFDNLVYEKNSQQKQTTHMFINNDYT